MDTEKRLELLEQLVKEVTDYGFNDEYGYYNDWADGVRPILEKAIAQAIAEDRERVRGMKHCRFGCYCKTCGLCDAETMIHCGDCVMNKPISLLSSLDKPLTDK